MTPYPGKKNPSWLPIGLAAGIPIVVIALGVMLAQRPGPIQDEAATPPIPEGPFAQAYITIVLLSLDDEPLQDRLVVFRHQRPSPETPGETIEQTSETRTDSAGIATVTLDKIGNVIVHAEGRDTPHRLLSLERNEEDMITVELVADR